MYLQRRGELHAVPRLISQIKIAQCAISLDVHLSIPSLNARHLPDFQQSLAPWHWLAKSRAFALPETHRSPNRRGRYVFLLRETSKKRILEMTFWFDVASAIPISFVEFFAIPDLPVRFKTACRHK